MPTRPRGRRQAMYNTPSIRSGGFGALQVEAITNRPLSIQRRHLAASQLRMREIEPDELSQSEWICFLVMEQRERDRWIANFTRRRRESTASSSSQVSSDAEREGTRYDKAEEARLETAEETRVVQPESQRSPPSRGISSMSSGGGGTTPFVSLWVRHLDELERTEGGDHTARRPMHMRRGVDEVDAPPAYDSLVPPSEAPPAYEARSDDEASSHRSRLRRCLRVLADA